MAKINVRNCHGMFSGTVCCGSGLGLFEIISQSLAEACTKTANKALKAYKNEAQDITSHITKSESYRKVSMIHAFNEDGELLERITVIVKDEIKTIEYPEESGKFFECVVVNDVVEEYDSEEDEFTVIEDTDDWYIQHKITRDVLYMGEIARDFELDLDGKPELVEIEGSWKAGKDFAKPGILMWGNPDPENEDHNLYRQEFALGDAEDMGGVVSRGEESVEVPYGTFKFHVLKNRDSTPIEPDVVEFKYYAPEVGLIKEEAPESGERVVLIEKTTAF